MKCENPLLIYLKNDNIYVKKKLLSMTKKDEKINNLILFNWVDIHNKTSKLYNISTADKNTLTVIIKEIT